MLITRMASSLRTLPLLGSFPWSRMIPLLLLGAFLFFTYRIVRIEVETNYHYEKEPPTSVREDSHLPNSTQKPKLDSPIGSARPGKAAKPRKRSREGSRREWYEKRKRRWFTPPSQELDRGLPRTRSRFKVA